LKAKPAEAGVSPEQVYFGGGLPTRSNQLAIENDRGIWRVFYVERGATSEERWFVDEDSACQYLWDQLRPDPPSGR